MLCQILHHLDAIEQTKQQMVSKISVPGHGGFLSFAKGVLLLTEVLLSGGMKVKNAVKMFKNIP